MSSDFVETNVHWEAFERFANEHGGKTDRYSDGGQDTAFNIKGKEIYSTSHNNDDFLLKIYKESKSEDVYKVFGVRNRMDGTTLIKVQSMDEFKKESSEFLDKISGKSPITSSAEEDAKAIREANENLAFFKKEYKEEFSKECPQCSTFLQKDVEMCRHCNYKF